MTAATSTSDPHPTPTPRSTPRTNHQILEIRTIRLLELLQRVEDTTLPGYDPPAALRREVRFAFRSFSFAVNEWLRERTAVSEEARARAIAELRRRFLAQFVRADSPRRFHEKPRGYAGDSASIEMIYDNRPSGLGSVGRMLDECFLAQPAAAAVRNRRGLLADLIREVVGRNTGRKTFVASLACGPARELFDVLENTEVASSLHATCVDLDAEALATVEERQKSRVPDANLELVRENLISVAFGRRKLPVRQLDLAYSIGLIDYFEDRLVIKLLDSIHSMLSPGGTVVLGNFHPQNPDRGLMECFLEWNLIHRSEKDMQRLFAASAFGPDCMEILYEEEGVNLFAIARKSST